MQPRVLVIADDLTGAMDAAAPFARRGLATRVCFEQVDRVSDADVLSCSTDSRHLPADEAAVRVRNCLGSLQGMPALFIKKIDSTLRGQVVAETVAAVRASGRRRVIVAPAVPAHGRVVRGGEVYVHGIPLADSAIGRDALSPPPRGRLDALFAAALPDFEVGMLAAGAALPHSGRPQLLVADAENADDLASLARQIATCCGECLVVGASGVAAALAGAMFAAGRERAVKRVAGPVLFVIGSRTPQSEAQQKRLMDEGAIDVPVFPDAGHRLPKAAVPAGASTILVHVAPHAPECMDSAAVADLLAATACEVMDTVAPGALVAAGGDTARALLRRLGVSGFELRGELIPGIGWGTVSWREKEIDFVTKAGGFGDEETLAAIAGGLLNDKKNKAEALCPG